MALKRVMSLLGLTLVILMIEGCSKPWLVVEPQRLEFSWGESSKNFQVWNGDLFSRLDFKIEPQKDWISVSPKFGSSSGPDDKIAIVVSISWDKISAGITSGSIVVRSLAGKDKVVEVEVGMANEGEAGEVKSPLYGLNFSPYIGVDESPDWTTLTEKQVKERLKVVMPYTKWVRTFGCTKNLDKVAKFCKEWGKKTAIGAWLGRDLNANEVEIESLKQLMVSGVVDLAVVGSETILRGDLSEEQLVGYIQRVKASANGVLVTTGEVYQSYINHPGIVDACDVIFVNLYPYWEGVNVNYAMYFVDLKFEKLKKVVGDKEIIISESGWPSDGNTIGEAVPSLENARFYLINFVSWAEARNVKYFYFEAYDEVWKANYEGPQGAHWGILDRFGQLKDGFGDVFDGVRVEDNWGGTEIVEGVGVPEVELIYIPPVGSEDFLVGKVRHVVPRYNRIATFIFNGGWWNKPTWDSPTVLIMPDGTWICDIVTHPNDVNATKIAVFVLPEDKIPPRMAGGPFLPQELYDNSLAYIEVSRS